MKKVSALEPAERPHLMPISTGELAALIRHHELFNKVLQRELPALAAAHCRDAMQKEGVMRAAAYQLNAHEQRLAQLRAMLEEHTEQAEELSPSAPSVTGDTPLIHPRETQSPDRTGRADQEL